LAIILHINTAFETASVFLSEDKKIISLLKNDLPKEHASFLEPAIKKICDEAKLKLKQLNAITVVNGPGSYTGLRVGLSSAKALCYALDKPLILLNTLDVMALALKMQYAGTDGKVLFCPVIDARRMEVFTALYDFDLNIISPYDSKIIDETFLDEYRNNIIVVGGSGSIKMQQTLKMEKFIYINFLLLEIPIVNLSYRALNSEVFASIAYSEPIYLKPVYFRNN
jgi:tRNA threonylcarbamoyladenosine biosynthesis protein TsaB